MLLIATDQSGVGLANCVRSVITCVVIISIPAVVVVVKTTASGLQYKVLKSGSGASPKKTDSVKVHYHGTLVDGKVFDSSVQRGEPVTFQVDGVIPGWVEALQLMKVGDKWQLFIPAKLAYGERIPDPVIGPNATLVFEVELLGIEQEK